jgi:hypothetical protein
MNKNVSLPIGISEYKIRSHCSKKDNSSIITYTMRKRIFTINMRKLLKLCTICSYTNPLGLSSLPVFDKDISGRISIPRDKIGSVRIKSYVSAICTCKCVVRATIPLNTIRISTYQLRRTCLAVMDKNVKDAICIISYES